METILKHSKYDLWDSVNSATISKKDDKYQLILNYQNEKIDLLSEEFLKEGNKKFNLEWRGFAKILLKDYPETLKLFDELLKKSPDYTESPSFEFNA